MIQSLSNLPFFSLPLRKSYQPIQHLPIFYCGITHCIKIDPLRATKMYSLIQQLGTRNPEVTWLGASSQGLSWDCSQDVGQGCHHLKIWPGSEEPLPSPSYKLLARESSSSLGSGQRAPVPPHRSLWRVLAAWQLARVMNQWKRQSGHDGSCDDFYNLFFEVTYCCFCSSPLVTETDLGTMWEEKTQEHEYQEAERFEGCCLENRLPQLNVCLLAFSSP